MQLQIVLAPGVAQEFQEEADFFRVLDSAVNDLDVIFYKAGAEVSRAENITAGYGENFRRGTFDKIRISSETGGAVSIVTRLGNEVSYDKPPTGNVTVTNQPAQQGSHSQWAITATPVNNIVQGASAVRRYFALQNKSATGTIYLCFGAAATAANGIRIPPGGFYETPSWFTPINSINVISDIASNPDVVIINGA